MKKIRTGAAHDALDKVDEALAKFGSDQSLLDERARHAAADALSELDDLARYVDDLRAALIDRLQTAPSGIDAVAQSLDVDTAA
ncbi:hypothetical protein [Saccharothrix xinjiangensis]|uniref:Uncharacterized protein n=1 Tax=Saccharothrix xinjiangensis TaxID=204798 RepID=A0ABV9XTK4_9PSEU